jgi:hypothetical protein
MPKILLIIFCCFLTISACLSAKNKNSLLKTKQGIEGFVYKQTGNQMPSPNAVIKKPVGFSTTIFIYEPTNIIDVSRKGNTAFYTSIKKKLVTTIQSDSTGYFAIELPVGSYSLFTKVGTLFYANLFDVENNIALIRVEALKVTKIDVKVDAGATY